jgi:polysaccharide deacetylase family sporulation protein PdaB
VAITFDDGPHPKYTPEILNILKKYNAKATFFVIGQNAEKYPDIIKREVAEGHEIGNHTYSHPDLHKIDIDKFLEEIEKTQTTIEDICGIRPKLFRPPGGYYDDRSIGIVESMGYKSVLWSLDTRDWSMPKSDSIVAKVEERAAEGDIILFHDLEDKRLPTPTALKKIIPYLIENGYEFVTVSELLEEAE